MPGEDSHIPVLLSDWSLSVNNSTKFYRVPNKSIDHKSIDQISIGLADLLVDKLESLGIAATTVPKPTGWVIKVIIAPNVVPNVLTCYFSPGQVRIYLKSDRRLLNYDPTDPSFDPDEFIYEIAQGIAKELV